MPIYEYRCTDCEHDIEAIQKFSDSPLTDCPSCGAPKLERLLSQSSFALKGGGWYADGYGGPGGKKDTKTADKDTKTTDKDAKTGSAASEAKTKTESTVTSSDAGKKKEAAAS